ncbi:MAG: hypothetical protein IMX02_02840 [Limnochordaceae bacterium]|nr:hypothetical protein [Limnochordaceae bacterium]
MPDEEARRIEALIYRLLRLDAAIRRLPERERAIVELRFAERARWSQIERRLGLTPHLRVALWDGVLWRLALALGLLDDAAEPPAADAPAAPVEEEKAASAWEPWHAFEATVDFLSGFLTAWTRPPSCSICGRLVMAGDDVKWVGEAPDGLAHLRCAAGVRGSHAALPPAAQETGVLAA